MSLNRLHTQEDKGQPFFAKQKLSYLLEQTFIAFNPEKLKWQWNDCINSENDIAENILNLS